MTYGLRGTLPRTGIYISPFTLLIFHRSVAHRGKKRNASGDRELFALRMLLYFFSKSIKTYRLGCAPRFMELSRDRTDCIFGFFLFSFSSFLFRPSTDGRFFGHVVCLRYTLIRNLWILKVRDPRFAIFLRIIRYFTMQEENFCKGKMRKKEEISIPLDFIPS